MKKYPGWMLVFLCFVSQFAFCQENLTHKNLLDDFKRNFQISLCLGSASEIISANPNEVVLPFLIFEEKEKKKTFVKINRVPDIPGDLVNRIAGFGSPSAGVMEISFSAEGEIKYRNFVKANKGKSALLIYKKEIIGFYEIEYPLKQNFNFFGFWFFGEFKKFLPLFSPVSVIEKVFIKAVEMEYK